MGEFLFIYIGVPKWIYIAMSISCKTKIRRHANSWSLEDEMLRDQTYGVRAIN